MGFRRHSLSPACPPSGTVAPPWPSPASHPGSASSVPAPCPVREQYPRPAGGVAKEGVAHSGWGWRVRSESREGPRTSPSLSFSFQLNPDCASGSSHVTGWHCGGGGCGWRGRGGLKITTRAVTEVIYNCLNTDCVPGTVLSGFRGLYRLRPHHNSTH